MIEIFSIAVLEAFDHDQTIHLSTLYVKRRFLMRALPWRLTRVEDLIVYDSMSANKLQEEGCMAERAGELRLARAISQRVQTLCRGIRV